jgi:hypothetical protein
VYYFCTLKKCTEAWLVTTLPYNISTLDENGENTLPTEVQTQNKLKTSSHTRETISFNFSCYNVISYKDTVTKANISTRIM